MLEEKLDKLTQEIVALRQAFETHGVPGATKAAAKSAEKAKPAAKGKSKAAADDEDEDDEEDDAPAPKKKAPAKKATTKKKAEPEHDEDEVAALFRKAAKVDKPKCIKYLKKQDCEDLAELLTQPDLYDAAYAFAESILEADDEDEDEDDDE